MCGGLTLSCVESFVSLGQIHLPIFGLFVAAGLMGAMALGLRTAGFARVDRDAFWDLSFVTALSAFLLSRVLLIAENVQLFLHFPIAVLELPLVSAGGVLATLVVVVWYVRRRKLPFVGVLEAAAPGAALLCCCYRLGEFAGGTRDGMPTEVRWAVGSSFGRVHPVELYMAASWLAVCGVLYVVLKRGLPRGETLGLAMILFGLVNTVTDFFHLPSQVYKNETLDKIEWRGLELMVFGGLLLAWRMAVPVRSEPVKPEVHDAV